MEYVIRNRNVYDIKCTPDHSEIMGHNEYIEVNFYDIRNDEDIDRAVAILCGLKKQED